MNEGQGSNGFGNALALALPALGLTAGLYRPQSAQHFANFATLMSLNQEREQKRKEDLAAQVATARQLGLLGLNADPSMSEATQLGFAGVQSQKQERDRLAAERGTAQRAYTEIARLRRPDQSLEDREQALQEYEQKYGLVPGLEPAFTRLRTQFAEERKRGVKAKEFGEGFMQDVPLLPELGLPPLPPSTTVREIPEPFRRGVTRVQDYIRETGEEPTAAAQMTRYGLPEALVVGGPEAVAERRHKVAQARKTEAETAGLEAKVPLSLEAQAELAALDQAFFADRLNPDAFRSRARALIGDPAEARQWVGQAFEEKGRREKATRDEARAQREEQRFDRLITNDEFGQAARVLDAVGRQVDDLRAVITSLEFVTMPDDKRKKTMDEFSRLSTLRATMIGAFVRSRAPEEMKRAFLGSATPGTETPGAPQRPLPNTPVRR